VRECLQKLKSWRIQKRARSITLGFADRKINDEYKRNVYRYPIRCTWFAAVREHVSFIGEWIFIHDVQEVKAVLASSSGSHRYTYISIDPNRMSALICKGTLNEYASCSTTLLSSLSLFLSLCRSFSSG